MDPSIPSPTAATETTTTKRQWIQGKQQPLRNAFAIEDPFSKGRALITISEKSENHYDKRKAAVKAKFAASTQNTAYVQALANKRDVNKNVVHKEKIEKRKFYKKRVEERTSSHQIFLDKPKNLSPMLDGRFFADLSIEERLLAYNKRHKCTHGYAYTSVTPYYNIKSDNTKYLSHLVPTCSCQTQTITSTQVDIPCVHCTSLTTFEVLDDTFPGRISVCNNCKNFQYQIIGVSRMRNNDVTTRTRTYVAPHVESKISYSAITKGDEKINSLPMSDRLQRLLDRNSAQIKENDVLIEKIANRLRSDRAPKALFPYNKRLEEYAKQFPNSDPLTLVEQQSGDSINDFWTWSRGIGPYYPPEVRDEIFKYWMMGEDMAMLYGLPELFQQGKTPPCWVQFPHESCWPAVSYKRGPHTQCDCCELVGVKQLFQTPKRKKNLHKKNELVQQQLGEGAYDMLTKPFIALFTKLKSLIHEAKSWVVEKIMDKVKKSVVDNCWEALAAVVDDLLDKMANNPLLYISGIINLMFAETHAERIYYAIALFGATLIDKLMLRCAVSFGFTSSSFRKHAVKKAYDNEIKNQQRQQEAERVQKAMDAPVSFLRDGDEGFVFLSDEEKIKTFFRDWKTYDLNHAKGTHMDLLMNFCINMEAGKQPRPGFYNVFGKRYSHFELMDLYYLWRVENGESYAEEEEEEEEEEPELAEQQSDGGLLDMLFSFASWVPKTIDGLTLIRDFNTVMSGWKNLHQLMQNVLTYLPNWMTKIFTITDPEKRFGVDAKTPGNPVYDMVQSYTNMLKGDNSGSPQAYDDFQKKWKISDKYILDYVPSEKVPRMHKHFWTNAVALMSPIVNGSKPIPFVVTLFGKPGTGKSTSWPLLLSGIIKGDVDSIREMSYTRNTTADFFDGYKPEKHKVFVYDDFGSQQDDTCAGELMSIVSNADFLPPFASTNDPNVGIKGTSFSSPIVVLCSNFQTFDHCHQIADKQALQRRLGIVINWNRKYAEGNTYEVFRTQPSGEQQLILNDQGNNLYTMQQIQDLLQVEYVNHFKQQTMVTKDLNKLVSTTPLNDFMSMYNDAIFKKTPDVKPVQRMTPSTNELAEQQGLGFIVPGLLITHAVFKLADYIDARVKKVQLLCAGGLTLLAAGLFGMKFLGIHPKAVEQSGEGSTPKAHSQPFFKAAPKYDARMQASDPSTPSLEQENVMRKFIRNQIILFDNRSRSINAIFIKGTIFLVNKHFFSDDVTRIDLISHRATDREIYSMEVSDLKIVPFDDSDLCLVQCPSYVQPFTDITTAFPTNILTKVCNGYITRQSSVAESFVYGVELNPEVSKIDMMSSSGEITVITNNLSYNHSGSKGDCGNLVMAELGGSLKILGLHVGAAVAKDAKSFAVTLRYDQVQHYLSKLDKRSQFSREEFVHEKVIQQDGFAGMNKTQFEGVVKDHIMSSGKTTLEQSPLYGKVSAPTMKPALLRRNKQHDPMVKALHKYGLTCKQFPIRLVEQAVDSVIEELMAHKKATDLKRELTLDECLNGIPGQVESVDLSTSSGYPFSLSPKLRGPKRLLIDGDPGELKLNPYAQSLYDKWQQTMNEGKVPSDCFIATLKDEKRKIEKVEAGKSRIFCAGSLTAFLHNKRHFGAFCTFFKRIRDVSFSTLGLNRASMEWHEMITYFKQAGVNGIDGDQQEWDGRFKAGVAMACLRIFDAYYENPNTKASDERYILFQHAIFTMLRVTWSFEIENPAGFIDNQTMSFILQISGCMPSGWYLTFVLNSIVNALLMRMCWISVVSAPFNDLRYFRQNVRDKYAGDDNLLAVALAFLKEFNGVTIGRFLDLYDQKYTPATKTGELIPYQRIEYCSFLKTTTGVAFDRYVPLFDMEANLETINWIRKCDDKLKAVEDNCNDALRNIFFYGQQDFDKYRQKMLQAEPKLNLINYYSLRDAFLEYGSIPDPFGTFTYTKRSVRDPAAFYQAVQRARIMAEEFSLPPAPRHTNMNTILVEQQAGDVIMPEANDVGSSVQTTGTIANLDEAQPQVTSKSGVHLAEQQQVVTKLAMDGNVYTSSMRATAHLNEPSWDLVKMLERENLVAAFKWNLTDEIGTNLTVVPDAVKPDEIDVPAGLLQNNLVSMPFMRFQWWRCERVKIRFQLVASRFHQGRLGVYFIPSCLPKALMLRIPGNQYSAVRWTQLQHAFLDPANGTVIDFTVPFVFNKGWIDLVYGDALGQLRVSVLNKLQAATGSSSSVEVKVYVSFEGSEFKVPRPGGQSANELLALQAKQMGFSLVPNPVAKIERPPTPLLPHIRKPSITAKYRENVLVEQQAGIFSGIGNELDEIVQSIVPSHIVDAAATILLDKPAFTEFPTPLVHKDAQYMSSSRGVENLERMTLEPSAMYMTDDQFGTSIDEMDIGYLIKKPVYYGTVNWSATQEVGTVLYQNTNSPTSYLTLDKILQDQPFQPTILGAIANMFTYWRGSINLTFQVVGTAFHEGRLDFCNHPAIVTPPNDYKASVSQYFNSQTIRNTNNTVEIRIPFHSDTPWKRVWQGQPLTDKPSKGFVRAMDFITGSFSMRVAVPLKNPSNVANNVDINIFVSAGEDFEFHTLSPYGNFMWPRDDNRLALVQGDSEKKIERSGRQLVQQQAGDLNTDTKDDKEKMVLGFGSVYTKDMKIRHFGESYKNLRECLKRYNHVDQEFFQIDNSTAEGFSFASRYTLPRLGGAIGYLSNAYRLFRGPLCYKVQLISNSSTTMFISYNPTFPAGDVAPIATIGRYLGYGSSTNAIRPPLVRVSDTQVAEFLVPYNSIYHSQLIAHSFDPDQTYYNESYFWTDLLIYGEATFKDEVIKGVMRIDVAFGDETRMGSFLGFPPMTLAQPSYPNCFPVFQ